jgi:hypothetical protein
MKSTPQFNLAHLVAFVLRPVADYEGATEAKSIAFFINQLERDAVTLGIVIGVDLEGTVHGISNDVEVTIPVYIYVGIGRTVIVIVETKLTLSLNERFSILIVEKIV